MQIFLARAVVLEKDSIEERETRHAGSKFFHRRHSPGVDRVSFSNVVVLCLRPLKKEKKHGGHFSIFFLLLHFMWKKKKTPCTSNIFSLPSCTRTLLSSLLRAKTDHHLFFSLVLFIENKQGFEESRSGICAKHTGVSRLDVFNSDAVGSHEWCRKNYRLYVGATVRID